MLTVPKSSSKINKFCSYIPVSFARKMKLFRRRKSDNEPQLFHQQIQWVVVVAQAFGLLPVQGVTSENCDNLTFRWYSPRAFYSEVIIFGCTINAIISFCRTIYAGFTLHHLSKYSNTSISKSKSCNFVFEKKPVAFFNKTMLTLIVQQFQFTKFIKKSSHLFRQFKKIYNRIVCH
jgi:hypothetical protein